MVKETTNEGNVMRRTLELKMLPEGDTEVIDGLVKYNIVVLNVGRDFLSWNVRLFCDLGILLAIDWRNICSCLKEKSRKKARIEANFFRRGLEKL